MVAFSQTTVQGRNTFPSTASEGTRAIEDPAGGSFAATKTAEEVFDSATDADNVYKSLENLRLALEANDPDAVTAAIDPIKSSAAHLNSVQSFFGHVQSRIQSATEYISAYDTRLSAQIGQLEDADLPAAITEMMEANVQLQAAFEMRAKMRQNSLFDYLG
jgi:flagellar hook-associated protein 3 FlgL